MLHFLALVKEVSVNQQNRRPTFIGVTEGNEFKENTNTSVKYQKLY